MRATSGAPRGATKPTDPAPRSRALIQQAQAEVNPQRIIELRRPPAAPPAPAGYTAEAAELWVDVAADYVLDAASLKLLDGACHGLMRAREAQGLLKAQGLTTHDRFNQVRPHPAAAIERDSVATMLRCLKALALDLEPVHSKPGRPPGR
jgi:hypothetical protein